MQKYLFVDVFIEFLWK